MNGLSKASISMATVHAKRASGRTVEFYSKMVLLSDSIEWTRDSIENERIVV